MMPDPEEIALLVAAVVAVAIAFMTIVAIVWIWS